MEKGSPGVLKVVAKSTEGPETVEGTYNTVSVLAKGGGRCWEMTLGLLFPVLCKRRQHLSSGGCHDAHVQ